MLTMSRSESFVIFSLLVKNYVNAQLYLKILCIFQVSIYLQLSLECCAFSKILLTIAFSRKNETVAFMTYASNEIKYMGFPLFCLVHMEQQH